MATSIKGQPHCAMCGIEKTMENTAINKGNYWQSYCKVCKRENSKEARIRQGRSKAKMHERVINHIYINWPITSGRNILKKQGISL